MCTQVSRTIGFLVRDKYTRPNPGYRFSKRSEIGSEEEENGITQQKIGGCGGGGTLKVES